MGYVFICVWLSSLNIMLAIIVVYFLHKISHTAQCVLLPLYEYFDGFEF